jgi:hypothetical protein
MAAISDKLTARFQPRQQTLVAKATFPTPSVKLK